MLWRVAVSLLLAAGLNTTPGKSKPRHWQPGEVALVEKPGVKRQPGWGTIEPYITSTTEVIMLESSAYGARWAFAITLPDAHYVVTLPPPPGKSSLTRLGPGSKLQCAIDGKTMYLKDDNGKVFRAAIRERLTR